MLSIDDSGLDRYQLDNLIERWTFDAIDRKILKRKLLDNVSIEKISEEIDMSPRQTSRRYEKAKEHLFKHV